jgi:hypothetical protein
LSEVGSVSAECLLDSSNVSEVAFKFRVNSTESNKVYEKSLNNN